MQLHDLTPFILEMSVFVFCIGLFGLSLVLFIYILMGFDYFKKQEDNYTVYILIHSL